MENSIVNDYLYWKTMYRKRFAWYAYVYDMVIAIVQKNPSYSKLRFIGGLLTDFLNDLYLRYIKNS